MRSPRSAMQDLLLPVAPLCGGQEALELRRTVERALRQHGAVEGEDDGERAARNRERAPDVGVADLVEALHGEHRLAREAVDRGGQGVTHATAVGLEDGEGEA